MAAWPHALPLGTQPRVRAGWQGYMSQRGGQKWPGVPVLPVRPLCASRRPEPSALPTTPSPSPLERTAGNQDAQARPGGDSMAQGTQLTSSRVRPVLEERAVDVSVRVHVAHVVQDRAGV